MSWYALQVRTSFEAQVQERLHLRGIPEFAPLYATPSIRKDRPRPPVMRRIFPGYVFADFDAQKQKQDVIEIPALIRIVGYGPDLVAIPDVEISSVRRMAESPLSIEPVEYQPNVGDLVVVRRGPLAGVEGQVVYDRGNCRIVVAVNMLHRAISVEVDGESLELVERAKVAA